MTFRPRLAAGVGLAVFVLLAPTAAHATVSGAAASKANAGPAAQVAAAKAATKGFTRPAAAKKAGYALLKDQDKIACIAMADMPGMPGGGMGVHYANVSLVDDKIDARHPEALVYRFAHNGHLKLAALEYLVTVEAWRANHPTGRPVLFGQKFNLTPAGNRFGLPAYFSLHAWFYYKNPAGNYASYNPRVYCPPGI